MSRYVGNLEIQYGWDPGPNTFYLNVFDEGGEPPLVALGTDFNELPTIDALRQALSEISLADLFELDPGTVEELEDDQKNGE